MTRTRMSAMTAIALVALSVVGFGRSRATAYEAFPEYERPQEVPVFGHLPPKDSRSGPAPRALVRLATHYLRISRGASDVRCHGIPGQLIACRVRIQEAVAARLAVRPVGRLHDRIVRCETTRLISGRLTEAPCIDFSVWEFNRWQEGPPSLPTA